MAMLRTIIMLISREMLMLFRQMVVVWALEELQSK